jgi:hypothetical protein
MAELTRLTKAQLLDVIYRQKQEILDAAIKESVSEKLFEEIESTLTKLNLEIEAQQRVLSDREQRIQELESEMGYVCEKCHSRESAHDYASMRKGFKKALSLLYLNVCGGDVDKCTFTTCLCKQWWDAVQDEEAPAEPRLCIGDGKCYDCNCYTPKSVVAKAIGKAFANYYDRPVQEVVMPEPVEVDELMGGITVPPEVWKPSSQDQLMKNVPMYWNDFHLVIKEHVQVFGATVDQEWWNSLLRHIENKIKLPEEVAPVTSACCGPSGRWTCEGCNCREGALIRESDRALYGPVEEVQELDPRYVTWEQLDKAYEHSASKKWNILDMAAYLRSLSNSNKEEFDGCPHAECVCAELCHYPTPSCLAKMPEKQELAWRKKIMG